MSVNDYELKNLAVVKALQNSYMIFILANKTDTSDKGMYSLKFEKNYFDICAKEDFGNYLINNKKLIYPISQNQQVSLIKTKGNDKVLVVGAVTKSDDKSIVSLDIMDESQNFKRCQTSMIDGDIPELEILIPDDTKEGAELIYPISYSSVDSISPQLIREFDDEKPPPSSPPPSERHGPSCDTCRHT